MRTCATEGCDNPHKAKGLCSTHYNQTRPDRHPRVTLECAECGKPCSKEKGRDKRYARVYCSLACRDAEARRRRIVRETTPAATPADRRSPLRRAVEDRDYEAALTLIAAKTAITTSGCHEWMGRRDRYGYPVVRLGVREYGVHRLVMEASHKAPLGSQPVHHKCANTACVNRAHLEPVTHRDNGAEMLARTYMERRIVELECALAALAPEHALLHEIGLPAVA